MHTNSSHTWRNFWSRCIKTAHAGYLSSKWVIVRKAPPTFTQCYSYTSWFRPNCFSETRVEPNETGSSFISFTPPTLTQCFVHYTNWFRSDNFLDTLAILNKTDSSFISYTSQFSGCLQNLERNENKPTQIEFNYLFYVLAKSHTNDKHIFGARLCVSIYSYVKSGYLLSLWSAELPDTTWLTQ